MVQLEPYPDDFRNSPLDYNLVQTLVIPESAKEPSRLGKILALGTGLLKNGQRHVFTVKVGDTVLTHRYPKTGDNLYVNNKRVYIVSESEILAVVNFGKI